MRPFVVYCYQGTDVHHLFYAAMTARHTILLLCIYSGELIDHIESKIGTRLRKIYCFSGGSAAQYKNCENIANISFHNADFGVDAKWHFLATARSKKPC